MNKNASKRRKRAGKSAKAKKAAAIQKIISACAQNGAPRPRVKLPDAMRGIGLDEHWVAQCLARHVTELQSKNPPRLPRKLLLDYLKECVRILYAPARRGDMPEQPAKIELVHFVPRPDRSNEAKPPAEPSHSATQRGGLPA